MFGASIALGGIRMSANKRNWEMSPISQRLTWNVIQKTVQHARWNRYPEKKPFNTTSYINGVILFILSGLDIIELERVW